MMTGTGTAPRQHGSAQAGFTLVELAIVMTIIGLLIGGILKGQELMTNSRVTATIAQVRSYESAITTFRDAYNALPGDFRHAGRRIPGCDMRCAPPPATAGNSIIGDPDWATNDWGSQAAVNLDNDNMAVETETVLFWLHLLRSDLISGVTSEAMNASAMQWGVTHPAARLAGGFIVGYADGQNTPPGGAASNATPHGLMMALVLSPTQDLDQTKGVKPMTPARAAQMDRKMDDGRPASGYVYAYGDEASCFSGLQQLYAESLTSNDCGVLIRVQG